jgi:hypothetical protein
MQVLVALETDTPLVFLQKAPIDGMTVGLVVGFNVDKGGWDGLIIASEIDTLNEPEQYVF